MVQILLAMVVSRPRKGHELVLALAGGRTISANMHHAKFAPRKIRCPLLGEPTWQVDILSLKVWTSL